LKDRGCTVEDVEAALESNKKVQETSPPKNLEKAEDKLFQS